MVYLAVKDSEHKGVYEFVSRGMAHKLSENFKQAVVLEEYEKERALNLADTNEITDALFLIRKFDKKSSNKKEKTEKKDNNTIEKTPTNNKKENDIFTSLINKMKDINANGLKITMFSGDEYYMALKSQFFINTPELKSKLVRLEDGEVVLNTILIDDLIKNKTIGIVPKSKFEVLGDYAVITNCDSKYSPNTKHDENNKISYEREYEKIVININQIESICKADKVTFGDYEIHQDIIIKYLVKKML